MHLIPKPDRRQHRLPLPVCLQCANAENVSVIYRSDDHICFGCMCGQRTRLAKPSRVVLLNVGGADDDYLMGFPTENRNVTPPLRVPPIAIASEAPAIEPLRTSHSFGTPQQRQFATEVLGVLVMFVAGASLAYLVFVSSSTNSFMSSDSDTALEPTPRVMTLSNPSRPTMSSNQILSAGGSAALTIPALAEAERSRQSVTSRPVTSRRIEPPIAKKPTRPRRTVAPGTREASRSRTSSAYKGHLRIDSDPQGAIVLINLRSVGTTPLDLRDYPFASYAVSVEHAGYRRWTSVVRVAANKVVPIKVALQKAE